MNSCAHAAYEKLCQWMVDNAHEIQHRALELGDNHSHINLTVVSTNTWTFTIISTPKETSYLMKTFNISDQDVAEYRIVYVFALDSAGIIEANEAFRIRR